MPGRRCGSPPPFTTPGSAGETPHPPLPRAPPHPRQGGTVSGRAMRPAASSDESHKCNVRHIHLLFRADFVPQKTGCPLPPPRKTETAPQNARRGFVHKLSLSVRSAGRPLRQPRCSPAVIPVTRCDRHRRAIGLRCGGSPGRPFATCAPGATAPNGHPLPPPGITPDNNRASPAQRPAGRRRYSRGDGR